jgi:hypothetical protein
MSMVCYRRIAASIIICCTSILVLAGCSSLTQITPFTTSASQAVAYSQWVDDYVNIIDELEYYNFQTAQTNKEIMDISVARAQKIAARRQVANTLVSVQNGLAEYINYFGKFTSDNQGTAINNSITTISKNMISAVDENGKKIFNSNDVTAFGGLAKIFAQEMTANYREEQLKFALESSHEHVNNLFNTLIRIAETDMIIQYDIARGTVRSNYYSLPDSKVDGQTIYKCEEKLAAIDIKARRAQGYANLIRKVQDAHNFLYLHRDELTSAHVLSTMQMYSTQIGILYNSLKSIN